MGVEHDFALSEAIRTSQNFLRYGTVKEVKENMARIAIGENLTAFLPFALWVVPQVGEHVLVLSPSGDFNQGICLAGITSTHAHLNASVELKGSLKATGDVADKKGTMQGDREVYNMHTHTDSLGGMTLPPTQSQ
jgi:phage baseplate assembly protein gpV